MPIFDDSSAPSPTTKRVVSRIIVGLGLDANTLDSALEEAIEELGPDCEGLLITQEWDGLAGKRLQIRSVQQADLLDDNGESRSYEVYTEPDRRD